METVQSPEGVKVKIWRLPENDKVELLQASAITQPLARQLHEEFAIGIVESGDYTMNYRGSNYDATRGSLIVTQPGEITSCGPTPETGRTFRAVHIKPDYFQAAVSNITGKPARMPYFPRLVVPDLFFYNYFLAFHHRLETPLSRLQSSSLLADLLTELILRFAAEPPRLANPTRDARTTRQVRQYLDDCYQDEINLEELAGMVNVSAFHLNRVFRQQVGLPPHAYQTQVRLERARDLLAQGLPINTVAAAVGFFDQSHLTGHFKRLFGFTPGLYQKNILLNR